MEPLIRYRIHNSATLAYTLSQMSPVHTFLSYFFNVSFSIIFLPELGCPKLAVSFTFPHKNAFTQFPSAQYRGVRQSLRDPDAETIQSIMIKSIFHVLTAFTMTVSFFRDVSHVSTRQNDVTSRNNVDVLVRMICLRVTTAARMAGSILQLAVECSCSWWSWADWNSCIWVIAAWELFFWEA
jgi:hypothetical protein